MEELIVITAVFCTTRFVWFHKWPEAPESVKYLRDLHRHEFHVKVYVLAKHDDRAIEFQTLKLQVDEYILFHKQTWSESSSCEMLAKDILSGLRVRELPVFSVEVLEDGENGALVYYEGEL